MKETKFGPFKKKIVKRKSSRKKVFAENVAVPATPPAAHISTSNSGRKRQLKYLHFKRMQTARRYSLRFRFAAKNENRKVTICDTSENVIHDSIQNDPAKQEIIAAVCNSRPEFVSGTLSPGGSSIRTPSGKTKMEEDASLQYGTPHGSKNGFSVHVSDKENREATTIKIPESYHNQPRTIITSSYVVTRNDLQTSRNKPRHRVARKSAGERAREWGFRDPGHEKGFGFRSSFEYAHDRAHELGGSDDESNLMIVTAACNTEMMLAEMFIKTLLNTPGVDEVRVTNQKEYIPGTLVVERMNYRIEWGNGYFVQFKFAGLRTEKPIFETHYYSMIPYRIFIQQQRKFLANLSEGLPLETHTAKRQSLCLSPDKENHDFNLGVEKPVSHKSHAGLSNIGFFSALQTDSKRAKRILFPRQEAVVEAKIPKLKV